MGVLTCSRYACYNVMCDTYIHGVGYVCHDCQTEFKEYLRAKGLTPTNEGEITRTLNEFIKTEKDSFNDGPDMDIDEFFRSNTR